MKPKISSIFFNVVSGASPEPDETILILLSNIRFNITQEFSSFYTFRLKCIIFNIPHTMCPSQQFNILCFIPLTLLMKSTNY